MIVRKFSVVRAEGGSLNLPDTRPLFMRKRRLDPMRETFWTLAMVIAWMVWRTKPSVLQRWKGQAWREEVDSVGDMSLAAAFDQAHGLKLHFDVGDAIEDFFSRALAGEVPVVASINGSALAPIDRHAFIEISKTVNSFDCLESGAIEYRNPVIERVNVLSVWPIFHDVGSKTVLNFKKPPATSKLEIGQWFADYLSSNPRQVAEAVLWAAAKTAMPTVSRTRFREVVKANRPRDWSQKSGPKGPRRASS